MYALVRLGGALSSLLILIAFGFTLVAVFWRYVLDKPLLWPEDVTGWTLVGLIMMGVSEAYRRGDHIAIDLAASKLGRGARALQEIGTHLAVLAFAVVLGISAWEAVAFAHDFGAYTSGNVEVPSWIPQAPMIAVPCCLG
jgi:TRAP-type C4-dicarboxylate transport system permease small subunit